MVSVMRKLSSNILSTALFSVAFSVCVVGSVWVGSAAFSKVTEPYNSSSTTTSTDPSEDSSDSTLPSNEDESPDQRDHVSLSDLYEMVNNLADDIKNLESLQNEQALSITELENTSKKLSTRVDDAHAKVQSVSDSLTELIPKLSKMTSEGLYTGTITPSQLSRKLTTDEISGDWSLERTRGQLAISALKVEFGACTPDSRYNVFLSVDPFRNITCLRIAK